jgi:non-specific serine/threonine protein kinase
MAIWTTEIKEIEKLYESLKGQLPVLEKELVRLIRADDENMILLYSRRCLEVIITYLCECELKRDRGTEPLKGIIDKLNKEKKVPSNIITSMDHLNSLSAYGAHPKDFDPAQVKPVLVNLDISIKWYLKFKNLQSSVKSEKIKLQSEAKQQTVSPPEKSIIVLPFENISPDPEQEYFSDGLTEEIITDLSHIHDLLVISRNSAMTFKGSGKTTKEIAEKVNVRYVLEGSVRKAGNNLRITSQLIEGLNDSLIWAEKYNGTLDDVFNIQEKVAQSIVEALKIKLVPEEKQKILARPIDNFQVYDLHIKAQNTLLALTDEGFKQALQYINKGLAIIGENEILYADMGQVYMHYIETGIDRGENIFKKVEECAEKVFSLNPNSANGYYLRGHLKLWRRLVKESIKDFMQAFFIDPHHHSLLNLALIYTLLGKGDSGRPIVQRLLKFDPLNTWNYLIASGVEIFDGQFNQAVVLLRKGYELEPLPVLKGWLARGLAYNNELEEACQLMDNIGNEDIVSPLTQMALFFKHAIHGEKSKALEIVTEDFKNAMKDHPYFSIWTAESYALLGLKEESIEWIEKGVNWPFINYPFLSKYDPFLENIRGEVRFKKLMERVKYEWEKFEV